MATSTQPEVESFDVGDLRVRIVWDSDPLSPREQNTLGTLAAKKDAWSDDDAVPAGEKDEFYCNLCREVGLSVGQKRREKGARWCRDEARSHFVILPVYVHKHSGITMRTSPFDDPWDSGQAGFIYVSREKVEERSPAGEDAEKWAKRVLTDEIETFGQYLEGDVYGFIIEDGNGERVDSCYGFYDLDYCKEQAKAAAEKSDGRGQRA